MPIKLPVHDWSNGGVARLDNLGSPALIQGGSQLGVRALSSWTAEYLSDTLPPRFRAWNSTANYFSYFQENGVRGCQSGTRPKRPRAHRTTHGLGVPTEERRAGLTHLNMGGNYTTQLHGIAINGEVWLSAADFFSSSSGALLYSLVQLGEMADQEKRDRLLADLSPLEKLRLEFVSYAAGLSSSKRSQIIVWLQAGSIQYDPPSTPRRGRNHYTLHLAPPRILYPSCIHTPAPTPPTQSHHRTHTHIKPHTTPEPTRHPTPHTNKPLLASPYLHRLPTPDGTPAQRHPAHYTHTTGHYHLRLC